jgi:arsenite-transporting ATPase
MRILLFTGKGRSRKDHGRGGDRRARSGLGLRTIVVSTDPAHSLSDAFDVELDDRPSPIAPGLWGSS